MADGAYGFLMKWGLAIFFYALTLIGSQTALYLILPKAPQMGCVRTPFPETASRTTVTSEYVYCSQTQSGIRLAKSGDFEASYFVSDPARAITITHFVMVERWSDLQKYSLISIGDRSRRLFFDARSGFQGEYQQIMNPDLTQLQRSVALKVNDIRYLQPANAGLSIPIVSYPFAVFKLFVHVFLIYYSIKLGALCSRLIQSHTLEERRRDAGLCIHCAYDCTDLPSPTCPECGQQHRVNLATNEPRVSGSGFQV